jgi:hypothetical protein
MIAISPSVWDKMKKILLEPPKKPQIFQKIPQVVEDNPEITVPSEDPSTLKKIWEFITETPNKEAVIDSLISIGWDACVVCVMLGLLGKSTGLTDGKKLTAIGVMGGILVFSLKLAYGL